VRKIKLILPFILFTGILFSLTSCLVIHDDGHHKGWYKNSNNPHNPNTTNPGHVNGHGKGNKNNKK
jgi:hypothetical protein